MHEEDMKSAQQVYDGLVAFMNMYTNPMSSWYAGIAADARDRLFNGHGVDETNGLWASDVCASSDDARAVEEALHNLVCQGAGGGGDEATRSCYVYFVTGSTRQ